MQTELAALRKKANAIVRLPAAAQNIMDGYLHLRVDGAEAACTYHINPGLRAGNRALLGKGRPEEIEKLAATYFSKYDMHTGGDPDRLRSFLLACGIGVDCSGFASWVLHGITESTLGRPIWKCLRFPGLRRRLVSLVRPVENISARLLTGPLNASPLPDLSQIRPGDLLSVANWHHVVVVIEVGTDAAGRAHYFQYAQSSCMYGQASGVRTGHAVITQPSGPLLAQRWVDNHKTNVIEQLIAEGGATSKAVRLKALL